MRQSFLGRRILDQSRPKAPLIPQNPRILRHRVPSELKPSFREDGAPTGGAPTGVESSSVDKSFSSEALPVLEILNGMEDIPSSSPSQPSSGPAMSSMRPGSSAISPSQEVRSYSAQYRQMHSLRGEEIPVNGQEEFSHAEPSTSRQDHDTGSVASALARAQQALDKAESSLDSIDSLPSARKDPPWQKQLPRILSLVKAAAMVACLSSALLASHAFGLIVQVGNLLFFLRHDYNPHTTLTVDCCNLWWISRRHMGLPEEVTFIIRCHSSSDCRCCDTGLQP